MFLVKTFSYKNIYKYINIYMARALALVWIGEGRPACSQAGVECRRFFPYISTHIGSPIGTNTW